MGSDPPIIIDTGGSIRIEFPGGVFKHDPKSGKYRNADKDIKRVEITVGGATAYDAKDLGGQDVVIKIHYGNA